jgi:REP element-mobilizing transposase RayT
MPNHLHAVVEGQTAHAQLPRFVRLAKQRAGFAFSQRTQQPLWQKSYFDRTLRPQERVADVIRYLINNPVRAGLVDRPAQYPHWGSQVCSREAILESVSGAPRV